ncbi:hypothetical protein MM221_03840 [Salipaludibacillus sp. LMS25]|jgi:hypothetical protein|uniref:hypothetical protein n=1 Tax=Salipaludibacillus sp. LMS25 TaxID=2924031 RepID=UPI0020D0AEC4|nr:hypothetical protein [Salipaludibacillus sp. LMS25]UTR15728.1 hypothetical protein MM221_03840 [Salipaludibacillus sp. LMS25]
MERNKLIILIAGFVILIILIFLLIVLEREDNPANPGPNTNSGNTETELNNSTSNNTETSNNVSQSAVDESTLTESEEELRTYAKEAISNTTFNDQAEELTQETLYDHALLYQQYTLLFEDQAAEEGSAEDDARWMALELKAWYDFAQENYGFSYEPEELATFVKNDTDTEEETSTRLLLEELASVNDHLYYRQLEFHYLRPYIWATIKDDVAQENGEDPDDDLTYLYYEVDQQVMEELMKSHPDLIDAH